MASINCKVGISIPFMGDPSTQRGLVMKQFNGVWDTGATNSVITKEVAEVLQLKPTGQTEIHTANGACIKNTYLVNIFLPSNVVLPHVRVTEGELGGIQMLIGMDVITIGDFSITNFEDKTTMSFRLPSCGEVDFVPEADEKNEKDLLIGMNRHQKRAYETQKRKHKK